MLRLPKIPQFAAGKAYGPRIAPSGGRNCSAPKQINEATPMLAEKFILLMETLKSQTSPDGTPRVVSASPTSRSNCRPPVRSLHADSGPQHAPAFQRLDHVAVVARTVIAVAGLLRCP